MRPKSKLQTENQKGMGWLDGKRQSCGPWERRGGKDAKEEKRGVGEERRESHRGPAKVQNGKKRPHVKRCPNQ